MLKTPFDCIERIDELGVGKPFIKASNLPRTGWMMRKVPNPETVGQHQIRCALMVSRFSERIQGLKICIPTAQDILLIHDIAEPDPRVGDITPHCNISEDTKRVKEEMVIKEILGEDSPLFQLWLDYEDTRTPEGRIAKEIDKLQAIEQARFYEDTGLVPIGTTEQFFSYSVTKKRQINTDFLLRHAIELYESKPR